MADAQQAAQQLQSMQRRLQALDQNLARLEQSMEEIHTAITTLEGLAGDAALNAHVPIGAGVRVPATVDPSAKVFVDLGKGYSTGATHQDAIAQLRDRLRNTEAAFRSASDEADKTARRMQELQMQLASSDSS